MEHLSLEIFDREGTGSKYATLPEDASITITETSEIFASGDVWTYNFTLNIPANLHIFGSAGDIHGSRLHEQIDKRRARLWVDGLPMYLGYIRLGDEVDVDNEGNVEISFESGKKTFEDMIDGANANQVPLVGDVKIGVALWRKRSVSCQLHLKASAVFTDGATSEACDVYDGDNPGLYNLQFQNDGEDSTQQYPRMVFPKGEFEVYTAPGESAGYIAVTDCINTDFPYAEDEDGTPTHPYCNVALCYQRYGYEKKQPDGSVVPDYSGEPEAQRGYEEMPANRINSAPNFYVLYWIRALMNHLGIYISENQLLDVEDLRRLFLVNTNCAYKEPSYKFADNQKIGWYRFRTNERLVAERFDKDPERVIDKTETSSSFSSVNLSVSGPITTIADTSHLPKIERLVVKIDEVLGVTDRETYEANNSWLHDAYATSECFPNVEISEVISAIEKGFGVRFLFTHDYQRVRIVLLRNLFRSRDVQNVSCDIISEVKRENNIRGFRMTYGNTEDTHFYYKGFNDMLPRKKELWIDNSDKHDYSHWNLNSEYSNIINRVSAFDKTCYVTPETGNAYGIKVDKNAKRYDELHQSLFEYAAFIDAEDGDCTGDDNTIEEINVGYTPAIMNDLNMTEEREGGVREQRFALFVDEKMRPRRFDYKNDVNCNFNSPDAFYDIDELYAIEKEFWLVKDYTIYVHQDKMDGDYVKPGEFAVKSDMYLAKKNLKANIVDTVIHGGIPIPIVWQASFDIEGHVSEEYRIYLQDNYEPNDDGVSPIETHDWGLTIGIMRGSGSDARVEYMPDIDDSEGNPTWDIVSGSSVTAHPDTCDCYGKLWDYNGDKEGEGSLEGRISLKLRAEKPNPYFNPKKDEGDDNLRYLPISNEKLRKRGLADQFYKEYSYYVRNARIAVFQAKIEIAQLLAIDKSKRVTIGDVTGFVRKIQYSVSNQTGLGIATFEISYL